MYLVKWLLALILFSDLNKELFSVSELIRWPNFWYFLQDVIVKWLESGPLAPQKLHLAILQDPFGMSHDLRILVSMSLLPGFGLGFCGMGIHDDVKVTSLVGVKVDWYLLMTVSTGTWMSVEGNFSKFKIWMLAPYNVFVDSLPCNNANLIDSVNSSWRSLNVTVLPGIVSWEKHCSSVVTKEHFFDVATESNIADTVTGFLTFAMGECTRPGFSMSTMRKTPRASLVLWSLSRTQKSYNQNLLYWEMSTRSGSNLVYAYQLIFIVTLVITYTS